MGDDEGKDRVCKVKGFKDKMNKNKVGEDKAGTDEGDEDKVGENRVGKDEVVSWRRMHFQVSKSSSDLATTCVCHLKQLDIGSDSLIRFSSLRFALYINTWNCLRSQSSTS